MPSSLFPQQIVSKPTVMSQPSPQLMNTMAMQNQPIQTPVQNQNNRDQILQLWNMVKNSSNPQAMFEQIISDNPQFKSTVDMINSMGDPQKLFYTMAEKSGTDPNSILSLLK